MSYILQEIGGWLLGLIVAGLVCLVLGGLGYTGLLVRKGNKYPIFIWIGIYLILFFIFPLKLFLLALLALIAPILGYFGIFFVPDVD